jgi:hypothetical protein
MKNFSKVSKNAELYEDFKEVLKKVINKKERDLPFSCSFYF